MKKRKGNIQADKGEQKNSQKDKKNTTVKWYDNADVKRILNISDSTLARYRKNKVIPFVLLGKKYIYPGKFFNEVLMEKVQNKHLIDNL